MALTPRGRALAAYLDDAAAKPWAWGRHDCCQFVRGWLLQMGQDDPAASFPDYATERQALRHLHRNGGLTGVFWTLGARAGLTLAEPPYSVGDVGVIPVMTRTGPAHAGAIFAGRRWVALAPVGIIGLTVSPILAWGF